MDRILNFDFADVIMNYRIVGPDEKGRPGKSKMKFGVSSTLINEV